MQREYALDGGRTMLQRACETGSLPLAEILVAGGALINHESENGTTALLMVAYATGHMLLVQFLLKRGAYVNHEAIMTNEGGGGSILWHVSPMLLACIRGQLNVVQTLASYGVTRSISLTDQMIRGVANLAASHGIDSVEHSTRTACTVNWLKRSANWSTPLHHVELIEPERAAALLRDGADLYARACPGGPTPFQLARSVCADGKASTGSAAWLVVHASKAWSPATHWPWSKPAREHAVKLLLLGVLLARAKPNKASGALEDVWLTYVIPQVMSRDI